MWVFSKAFVFQSAGSYSGLFLIATFLKEDFSQLCAFLEMLSLCKGAAVFELLAKSF